MHYLWQHIKTILSTYNGSVPLTHFLKNYCRQYPILGSRDRRMISTIIYSWYRCSRAITFTDSSENNFERTVRASLEQCNVPMETYSRFFADVPPALYDLDIDKLFPHNTHLSAGISRKEWLQSMLVQPQLFIRIRKHKDDICTLLDSKQIPFTVISANCLSLPNGAAIDKLLPPESYVVQDASSQQTGDFFNPQPSEHWYDCCSGAGGKSLLLMDKGIPVKLTVTDKRASIINNLQERFKLYGHRKPAAFVADTANETALAGILKGAMFDNIICDAPCSGSGTWGRTPEQLHFFKHESIAQFSALQKTIALNASGHLTKGGKIIYITCSVFSQENEDVVNELADRTGLRLIQQKLINGTTIHADSMFVAVLERV